MCAEKIQRFFNGNRLDCSNAFICKQPNVICYDSPNSGYCDGYRMGYYRFLPIFMGFQKSFWKMSPKRLIL